MPRDRRRRRAGRARPGEHRRQRPARLPGRLAPPARQAVKENYHAIVVATDDGRVYTGIKLRQTDTELVLRDAEDREVAIPLTSIDEQKTAGSIMPAGLADELTRPELVDLVRFLSELGKIGPYAVGTGRVCRRWQVLEPTPEVQRRPGPRRPGGRAPRRPKLTWRPAYTTVAGLLPPSEWAESGRSPAPAPVALARTQIQVTTGGKVKLSFDSTEGLSLLSRRPSRRADPGRR